MMACLNMEGSFLFGDCCLFDFLGGFVLGLLLCVFVLGGDLLGVVLLGGEGSLAILDLSDSLFGEGLLVLGPGSLDLFDIVKGDALDGSLLSEDFLLLVLALIGQFELLVEAAPSGGPSQSLGLELSAYCGGYLKLKSLVRLLRKRKGRPSLATNLIPRPW